MNSVEKELGCVLFTRSPHFQLTYEGEKFYQYVKAITGTYESMQKEFQLLARNESGVLRIGIAHTRSHALIPRAARKFIPEHPYIRLDLQELSNDGLISGLQEGELDLAIGDIPLDSPDYAAQELFKDEILLVVSGNYVDESSTYTQVLSRVPLLVNHREDVPGRIASMILKEIGIVPKIAASSDNTETLLDMCDMGLGACFCSEMLFRFHKDTNQEDNGNGIVPKIAASSDNTETLLDMCDMGLGACFCSEMLFRFHKDTNQEDNGKVRIFHTGVTYSIVAAYQKMCDMGLGACFCSEMLFRFHKDTNQEDNGKVRIFHTGVTYSIVAAYQKTDVMSHLINSFIKDLK